MRRARLVLMMLGALSEACSARDEAASADAGVVSSGAQALAVRRSLRDAPVAAPAANPSTFAVPSPITPMPDRSGRYVMRRRDSATFFTPSGLAFSLAGGWALHSTLVGARDGALVAERQEPAHVHHYVGPSSSWTTDMPSYGRLAWEDIYPGIDMVAESARGGPGYRFVLSPGAKVSDLVTRWEGATAVRVVEDGRGVDVETGVGVLRVRGLRAFAIEGGQRIELPARHVARGNDVALEVDGWNGRVPLVIDPTIAWSSYLGGSDLDAGNAIAVDGSGDALVTGYTQSADFPTTAGLDTTIGATRDAFVTKVSSTGALVWSSYLGGGAADSAYGIAADAMGNVFVTGDTNSSDFPTTGGFDTTLGSTSDAFVTKLSGSGALLWSSYLGGGSVETGFAIAVDGSGNAFVTGQTASNNFPTTGGFDTTFGSGTYDGFVAKVSGAGALLWSSFLGGSGSDVGNGIAVDGSGNAFVAGQTASSDFPSSAGFDTTLGGTRDAFVTKVSGTGALVWSSFLGGGADETAYGVAIDGSGNAFVTGQTSSTDFPSSGGFDTSLGGANDAYVTKVSGGGSVLWSSFLGGGLSEVGYGIAVDGSGDAFVTGYTFSSDFPTSGGFDTSMGGSNDGFVAKVSGTGPLRWSSYIGGSASDTMRAVAVDGSGNVLMTSNTFSADFPSTGGFDTTRGGSVDASVTKLAFVALGTSCTVAAECRSSICADGVCCDKACAGTCEACSAAKKGAGTNGTCAPIVNGSDPDKECAAQSCTAGVVTKAQVCNGSGACRADGTMSCGLYPCAGAACATSCATDAECIASAFCSGTTCTADLDIGAACARASQCKSGFCADGVCCDKACTGACEACSATKKGSGTDGTCAPVAADTDPKNACAADTGYPASCGADGQCDGAGSCRSFAKAGTACGATTCTAGSVAGKVCAGDKAACVDDTKPCAPYACGGSACKTSCTTDSDCTSDAFCTSTKACTPRAANGTTCKEGRECASGFCTDGVCCNAACGGQCESCNEPKTAGTCTVISGVPRGDRPACDTLAATDCAKTACDGTIRDKCAGYANGTTTPCGEQSCTGDKKLQKPGACDGHGKCLQPEPKSCVPYVCDLAAPDGCKSSCTADGDCAEGYACSDGKCIQGAKCNADRSASVDKTGKETPCAPYLCGSDGRCLQACATTNDCAGGNVCNIDTKVCVPGTPAVDEGTGCGCTTPGESTNLQPAAALLVALAAMMRRRR